MERVLGLDLGSRTCGIAMSDALGMIAHGVETYRFAEDEYEKAADYIKDIIDKNNIKTVVLGLPKHMNGDLGIRAEISIKFKEMLERRTGLTVELWDERLTTVAADNLMMEAGIRRENRKEYVDQIAASFILQGYLDYLQNEKNQE